MKQPRQKTWPPPDVTFRVNASAGAPREPTHRRDISSNLEGSSERPLALIE